MACNNCKNCGDSSKGASQRSLVAYIQPCGAKPTNNALNAMVDGNYGSAIKVTGGKREIRGARTAKYRRTSTGGTELCFYTQASPGENTVSLEFASCGCGGYSPEELAAEGTFDLYQMQACCGSADMVSGWSKMHVMRCITFNSVSFSDETSYDADDDNDLVMTFDANYIDDYYLYPLTMSEIVAGTGFDAGARINNIVFYSNSSGCASSCKDDCADYWYAVTNEGTVIYRFGSDNAIKNVSIPGYTASAGTHIGIVGNRLVVSGGTNYYTTTINTTTGAPGTWTTTAYPAAFNVDGMTSIDDAVIIYGAGASGVIYSVNSNGVLSTVTTLVAGETATGYDECGSVSAAVTSVGRALIGSTCGTLTATTVAPTSDTVMSVAVRPGGEVWVGTSTGRVHYTADAGESWNEITLPATAAGIRDIKWADAGVGYIISSDGTIFTTADGGNNWAVSGSDDRIDALGGVSSVLSAAIPCCTSKSKTMNNIMFTGVTSATAGGIWKSSISSCT